MKQKKQSLTVEDKERFAPQLLLPGMNEARQLKLNNASAVIIGLTPPGLSCAINLAQAGIGKLILQDHASVQLSDLSTHFLFSADDIGAKKTEALQSKLSKLHPQLNIEINSDKFNVHNAEKLLQTAGIAIEALENWQDKLLASDSCMRLLKPLIHSGIIAYSFHVFSMIPSRSACLRCVFAKLGLEDFPPDGIQKGMLGAIASLVGSFQAAEAIKLITQIGTISGNHLLRFDVLRSEFDDMTELTSRSDCPDCGRAN